MAEKKQGRPSKLTPETQKKIVAALKDGNFFSTACELAGIHEATGYRWIEQGAADDAEPAFREFRDAVKKAEAYAEQQSIKRIRQAAKGGRKVTKRTIKTHPDGVVEVTEVEEYEGPSWQADAWYLERKHPTRWGRKEAIKVASGENDDTKVTINLNAPKGRTL